MSEMLKSAPAGLYPFLVTSEDIEVKANPILPGSILTLVRHGTVNGTPVTMRIPLGPGEVTEGG